jgi:hypothetical protein
VNQVDPDNAEGLLLFEILLIQHADVENDLVGLGAG